MKIKARMALSALLLLAVGSWVFLSRDRGQDRFFADQSYHFQTLREFSEIPAGGADTGEILQTIRHIESGNAEQWFREWSRTSERLVDRAKNLDNPLDRGRTLLRAHSYLRTAEFFLSPEDPRRMESAEENATLFYGGLDSMRVAYERFSIPYQDGHLNAVYYPTEGGARRPLLVFFGGFDSTLEELYFALVCEALNHGYSVLTFEGPGQGMVLRRQNMKFTPEWEKPTSAVLDAFLNRHSQPNRIVLIGMSMGGYLAARAAAFDRRIDGVVSYDVYYDMGETARELTPPIAFWLHDAGLDGILNVIISIKSWLNPGFKWAAENGQWTLGTNHPIDTVRKLEEFNLRGIAQRIEGDVLILAGEKDHFIPLKQVKEYRDSLNSAHSVTTIVYDEESGGAEHCQLGAPYLWQSDLFQWLGQTYR